MPRKTSRAAEQDYLQADYDRWRLLARNPDFRKDLVNYVNACGPSLSPAWRRRPVLSPRLLRKFQRLEEQYLQKWGIIHVPDPALLPEADLVLTPEVLERWYQAARQEQAELGQPGFTTGISSPVWMTSLRRGVRRKEMLVEFRLDMSFPVDQLLAIMEQQVRSWYWKHFGERPRGKPPSLDFHLEVFDLYHSAVAGKPLTFSDIATKLKGKPSSVRDAYFAACRKIGVSSRTQVSAESVPHPGDVSKCPDSKCRNAKTDEDFCPAHRGYLDQDEGSQLTGISVDDWPAFEGSLIRKASGRKHPKPTTFSDD